MSEELKYKCPKCNGNPFTLNKKEVIICNFCHGKDLTWIECIFGAKSHLQDMIEELAKVQPMMDKDLISKIFGNFEKELPRIKKEFYGDNNE
jgi:DNA-directed RNA polymerase subunit RPC12/RpoP